MISIVEVFSASSRLTYKTGDYWDPITHHIIYLIIGVVVLIVVHLIPYKWFQALSTFLLPFSIILLIIVILKGFFEGERVNDAARWIMIPILNIPFQPSELAKMAVIIATSYILSKRQSDESSNTKAFKYITIITGIVCALIVSENLSTAVLLFGVVVIFMFIGQIAIKKLSLLLGSIAVIVISLAFVIPEDTNNPLLHRFTTWKGRVVEFVKNDNVPPEKYNIKVNTQVTHAHIAIASSDLVGKAPGNSVQREFLIQAFSDFIFAIIIEEMGLIGGTFVVMLYIWLLIRAGRIAKKCNRAFPAFLVIGITLLLVSQAISNMMVAVGLFPVTGLPLPLISKGGTSILINCVYIGMILSVSRYTILLEKQKDAAKATEEGTFALQTAEPTTKALNSDSVFEETMN
jgi:cell division protein FtsW